MPLVTEQPRRVHFDNWWEWGQGLLFRNLLFVPWLRPEGAAVSQQTYVPLPQAISDRKVIVKEIDSVPFLRVENCSNEYVFALAGMYLRGGAQDRMLAISLVLRPGASGEVPVRCVEKRRWDSRLGRTFSTPESGSVVSSKINVGTSHVGQEEIWASVADLATETGTQTDTGRLGDVYEATQAKLQDYVNSLTAVPLDVRAVGCLFFACRGGIRGHFSLDLFGQPELFRAYLPSLCEAAALTAITLLPPDPSSTYPQHHGEQENLCRMAQAALGRIHLKEDDCPVNDGQLFSGHDEKGDTASLLTHAGLPLHVLLRWRYGT